MCLHLCHIKGLRVAAAHVSGSAGLAQPRAPGACGHKPLRMLPASPSGRGRLVGRGPPRPQAPGPSLTVSVVLPPHCKCNLHHISAGYLHPDPLVSPLPVHSTLFPVVQPHSCSRLKLCLYLEEWRWVVLAEREDILGCWEGSMFLFVGWFHGCILMC